MRLACIQHRYHKNVVNELVRVYTEALTLHLRSEMGILLAISFNSF